MHHTTANALCAVRCAHARLAVSVLTGSAVWCELLANSACLLKHLTNLLSHLA